MYTRKENSIIVEGYCKTRQEFAEYLQDVLANEPDCDEKTTFNVRIIVKRVPIYP